MRNLFLIFIGAGTGGVLRYWMGNLCSRWWGLAFPWHTLLVNVIGSTLMGVMAAWLSQRTHGVANPLRLLLATGLLGGFTTFSAFSLDAVTLWQRGQTFGAVGYVGLSVSLSLIGLYIGLGLFNR